MPEGVYIKFSYKPIYIVLAAIDDSPSCPDDSEITKSLASTKFAHPTFAMASRENHENTAPTTNHQNDEGVPHSAHGRGAGSSRAGGRGSSRVWGGRGDRGHQGNRGNKGGRGGRGGFNKKKEVGRAEWAYVIQTASSIPSGLTHEAVLQLTEEHATMSEL